MFVWNVMPPCAATLGAIAFVAAISVPMALTLAAVGGVVMIGMLYLAVAGKALHHEFADKAAAVDGEMVDVIGNMSLVQAFCGRRREHNRFDRTIDRELDARSASLLYLERLRLLHAVITVTLTVGMLAWAVMLWQDGRISSGDVVLACTLGLSVLHATRDLAVALVDVTQHLARLSEAVSTLLVPHDLPDHPERPTAERQIRLSGARCHVR
jgi:ATP-binding cassette subfamily B protein